MAFFFFFVSGIRGNRITGTGLFEHITNKNHRQAPSTATLPGERTSLTTYYVIQQSHKSHSIQQSVTMDPSYKARKEAFVSDLSGGSILEINAVTLVAPVCVFFLRLME